MACIDHFPAVWFPSRTSRTWRHVRIARTKRDDGSDAPMEQTGVLVTARCPDPKLAKAALAPFHVAADGVTTTSASGAQRTVQGLDRGGNSQLGLPVHRRAARRHRLPPRLVAAH